MKMEQDIPLGTRVLNGFLRVMVIVLALVLAAVLITLILALFGVV